MSLDRSLYVDVNVPVDREHKPTVNVCLGSEEWMLSIEEAESLAGRFQRAVSIAKMMAKTEAE